MSKKMQKKRRSVLSNLESEIRKEKKELDNIDKQVFELKEKLLEKRPEHFGKRDIVNAFFGALLVGITFVFKGNLIDIGIRMSLYHVIAIVIGTIFILTAQIYFIGYSRVINKKERPFGQFWVKRLSTLYGISIIVSLYLIYIFGIDQLLGNIPNLIKIAVIITMPSAIGAAIPSLIKQY